MSATKLEVIPLGGVGEFGMNSLALRYGDDIVVIDAGMMFPEDELLGVDVVTPDFSYLVENSARVRGLILTHGHEDHIGGVPYLLSRLNLPVYGTPFTLALVERRLREHELDKEAELNEVTAGSKIELGCFSIEFIHVTHSIPQAVALAITTPVGVVVHTGDFKVDPTPTDGVLFDLHTLAEYGRRGVLLLLSDSTNSDSPGYSESERAVRPRLETIFARAEGRVVVTCFASSIHRVQQIIQVCRQFNRKLGLLGRSLLSATEIAHDLGVLEVPDGLLLRPQDIMQMPRHKVAVIASGSQGEPMAAISRVAVDNHKHLKIEAGDTIVHSARMIPGNEKSIFRMVNHMARRGADVIYGRMNPPVHVSGHATIDELRLLLNLLRPRFFMPIHGEYRQLAKHAALAEHLRPLGLKESFLLESGQVLEVDQHSARRAGTVTVGRVCIDSGSVDEIVEEMVIRDRRNLSEDGFVLPIIAINQHTGKSEARPEIVSRGFVSLGESNGILDEARKVVARTIESSSVEERTDWGVMKEKIRTDLRRYLIKHTSKRPLIMPVILEV